MMRTVQFACMLPKADADALNRESGRIYTDMLVSHYRLWRKQQVWLTKENGERWEDQHGGPTTLHAHSRDAAQQGFYKACKTARACKEAGLDTKYPHHQMLRGGDPSLERWGGSRALLSIVDSLHTT